MLNGQLSQHLHEQEMQAHIGYWRQGMRRDKDDFILAVNERDGAVALLLNKQPGRQFVNEAARRELRRRWSAAGVYKSNLLLFIPNMARQLHGGNIWTVGVKVMPTPQPGSRRLG